MYILWIFFQNVCNIDASFAESFLSRKKIDLSQFEYMLDFSSDWNSIWCGVHKNWKKIDEIAEAL